MLKGNYINKCMLLVVSAVVIITTASARNVSQAEALQVATNFFSGSGAKTLSTTNQLREIWNSNHLSQGNISLLSSDAPTFYVFAPETGKGFVIVSAEDAMSPILGYSFEDKAPEGNLPCNLQAWFEAMNKQISEMRAGGATATEEVVRQWASASVGKEVLLLETAQWNQESPYNQQCPMDGNSRSVTGCVSTATAIVMRYYQYPDRGTGVTDAYTTSTRKIYVDSRSLEHEYNWSVMPLEDMSGNYTDEQAYAVSTLMADIGYLLQADYTSDETGTVISGTQNVKLYEHFGYSPSMYWLDREEFNSGEWHNILKDGMNSHGPVIYSSFSHMFILDGYTDDDYFHVNWGWGGYSNGYFLLSDLEALDDNRALINFYPHDGSEPESTLRMCVPGMVADTEDFASGESFLITDVYIENASTIDFSGSMQFALADKDGNVKEWISNSMSLSLSSGYYTHRTNVSCTIKEDISAGDRIRLFYHDSGSEEWKLLTSNTSKCQWEIIIDVYADLSAPVAAEATGVDAYAGTFTARWSAVEGASGYQVMLTQIVPQDSPWEHTLMEESFDKCYSTELNTGNDISNNLDSYLSSTGWTGQYLYTSPDYLHIGNGSDEGYVKTPLLDAQSESAATVYLNYSFSSGGTDVIRIEILNSRGSGQTLTLTHTHSQAGNYNYILHVLNWSSDMYVGIHSTNVNLNGLYVFDGSYSEDDLNLDNSNNIESTYYVTDTSYTFTGMENAEYTYKVRAFSAEGSSEWSNTIKVDLTYTPPTVQTYEATDITHNTATLNGAMTAGSEEIEEQGFEYWSDGGEVLTVTASGEEMTVTLSGLAPNTTYTYRTYVRTASGTIYGEENTFTTDALVAPTVQTNAAGNVTSSSATLNGSVTAGTEDILEQGFEYWTTDGEVQTVTSDEMTVTLTGLTPGTTYHYRAYAKTESDGTTYGEEVLFTTGVIAPTLQTISATDITYNSATLNATIAAGSEEIEEQGFEYWSGGGEVLAVTASGEEMTVTLSGLTPNTTYTYRPYARTASGTTYGDNMTFSTLFDMEGAYAEMVAEIEAMREKLTNSWSEIAVDYADIANEFSDTYNTISTKLDELLLGVMDSYNTTSLNEEIMEVVRQRLATISQEIDDMLDKAKQAEKDYIDGLYAMLVAEVEAADMDLSNAWTTIETEYLDMVDDLQTKRDEIAAEIKVVKIELDEAYEAGKLSGETMEIRERLAIIEQEIEEMLNYASRYTSIAGVRYDCDDDERVYDLAGSRVHRLERGNVYIIRYSDGSVKKVLVK